MFLNNLINLFFVSFLAAIAVQIHANSTEPEFNCEHEPCEGGITHFKNWSFDSACDSYDYNVWVKYNECPGPPEYPRQCFAVCDPLGYVDKINIIDLDDIPSTQDHNTLHIYPNPLQNIIEISIKTNNKLKILRIFDSLGKLIKQETISPSQGISNLQIDTRDFPRGIYLIQIRDDYEFSKSIKFFKE